MNLISMSFEGLHLFLTSAVIPEVKHHIGFLEIIRKHHHENINSSLYRHFINSDQAAIRIAFLESLHKLIHSKTAKNLPFAVVQAYTEVTTSSGRIDILIKDKENKCAVIIENKIYHELKNDLLEYWNHIELDETKKVGVLLTLKPHPIPDQVSDRFINITHFEWVRLVKERLDNDLILPNYRVYLNDFIQTIEKLTTTYEMNEAAKFYFSHAEQVLKASETMNQAHDFLEGQFNLIAEKIGWQTYGEEMGWRNFWDAKNQLDTYLTIVTEDLLEGKMQYTLILELLRKDRERAAELREHLGNHPQTQDKKPGEDSGVYLHFLCKDYFITETELTHFSDHVVENIRKDFADMTVMAIQLWYPTLNISAWEQTFRGKEKEIAE
jgi:hypothetical protein